VSEEGQFPIKNRGDYREELLSFYRWGLRRRTNPETEVSFTEDEITTITAEHGEAWIRADALDAVLMLDQARAQWLLPQLDPETAATSVLKGIWSVMWDLPYLAASGGSGSVAAPAPPGTTFVGSPVLGDPTAVWGTVQGGPSSGLKFQVLFTVQSPLDGSAAELTLAGIDTGYITNLEVGTKIKWVNAPDTVTELALVDTDFTGGNPAETDPNFAERLLRRIRHKQAAANNAHVQAWIEDASTSAVQQGFVYACAANAGTAVITFLQRRGNVKGPLGRIPTAGTIAIVTSRLVPPSSPLMPPGPEVWVTGITGVSSDLVLDLSMPKGSTSGWQDFQPWPGEVGGVAPEIAFAPGSQTHFTMSSLVDLPAGGTVPALMVWDATTSRFEQLQVLSVVVNVGGPNLFDVVLSAAPTKTLAAHDWISPATERADLIDVSIENYFDSLGPGELVAPTDARWHRAFRFPQPTESAPQRAGSSVTSWIGDALGGSLSDATLAAVSVATPPLPADIRNGPKMLVAGRVSLSAL
jgi:hypothetical protein